MWLTGFDVPCLHTMYVDKYMHAHGLMQAIARVNRVFRDKPGGLVVDYLGIAQELKKRSPAYTEGGGEGDLTRPQHEAVELMLRKHQECCALFEGFDWSGWAMLNGKRKVGATARSAGTYPGSRRKGRKSSANPWQSFPMLLR